MLDLFLTEIGAEIEVCINCAQDVDGPTCDNCGTVSRRMVETGLRLGMRQRR